MTEHDPITNLQILEPSRKAPKPGDIFAMKVLDIGYLFGRVIANDAKIVSMKNCVLIYIYKPLATAPEPIPSLKRADLLLPPVMTNRLPWSRGYFKLLENRPLRSEDVLSQHCFHDFEGRYFDEHNNPLSRQVDPCGDHGLHSYRTIDDEISKALGIPMAPEDDDSAGNADSGTSGAGKSDTEGKCRVTIYMPATERSGIMSLSELEQLLIRAVEAADVGVWEGHGTDLRAGLSDIQFVGPDRSKLIATVKEELEKVRHKLPPGWHIA